MSPLQWLAAANKTNKSAKGSRRGRVLRVESLEVRTVPSSTLIDQPNGVPVSKSNVVDEPPLLAAPEMPGLAHLDLAIAAAVQHAWQVPTGTTASEWLIQLPATQSPEVLQAIGATSYEAVPFWPNAYSVRFSQEQLVAEFPARLATVTQAEFYYPLIYRMLQERFTPNDPLFGQQWHLRNTGQSGGTPGQDANLVAAWDVLDSTGQQVRGDGVVIGIVDDGLQRTHPDLVSNYVAAHSHDFNDGDSDPSPDVAFDYHGTAVAGVAAARGNNSLGVTGAAMQASLAGIRLTAGSVSDSQEAQALSYHSQDIDIYNSSWGPYDDATLGPIGPQTLAALANSTASGRGGLGSIYTWAAGNGLDSEDNVNYDGYANSRYVIAVGAITNQGQQAWYSEPGAPMLVTAYSSGGTVDIRTTDLTGSNGYDSSDYAADFGGTSSATPLVSGIIALMLDANPNLSYRDVQHILVNTAELNDPGDSDWRLNGAGFHINHKYGFGAIDALAAVNRAKTWSPVSPEITRTSGQINVGVPIPDNNPTGVFSSFNMTQDVRIEHVEVVLNVTHTWRGDLRVVLTAPSGTQSVLAETHINDSGDNYPNWVFSTVRHWGESALGNWSLRVIDGLGQDVGTFNNWRLNFYGTPGAEPPVLSGIETTAIDYVVGQGEMTVSNSISVVDPDSTNLTGATVTISNGYVAGQDFLRFTNQNGISGSFSGGTLTLTGSATLAQYQAALRSVRYENTSITPNMSPRTVQFSAKDQTNLFSNLQSRIINIIGVNLQPTLNPISDPPAINEDAGLQTINLSGISAGPGQSQDLVVTATSDKPSLIPNPTVNYTSPGSTATLNYAPAQDQFGTAVITVKVKDSGGTFNGGVDEIIRTFTVVVNSANDAPTFTPGPDLFFNLGIGAQTIPNWATNMSSGPPDENGQNLSWQISNDNNGLFATQPSLDLNGTLTFDPAFDVDGSAHVFITLTDDGGTANGGVNVGATYTLFINIEANDAPTVDGNVTQQLTPIPRNKINPAGDTVEFIIGATVSDPDPIVLKGVAVVGLTGETNGTWQYSIDAGANWLPFGSVGVDSARLLRSEDLIRFVPNAGFMGTALVSYHAWDQTSHVAGDVVDLSAPGATGHRAAFSTTAGSAQIRVAMSMISVVEDTKIVRGDQIKGLLGVIVGDVDLKAKRGIAITQLSTSAWGTWQYSINGGITWKPMGNISPSNALLLRDLDKVRFVGNVNSFGEASFRYRAWDQTTGKFGTYVDLSSPQAIGGGTAFSIGDDIVFAEVTSTNDRPVLDKSWKPTLTAVDTGNPNPPNGNTISALIGSAIVDGDVDAPRGIAVTTVTTIGGQWQYRLNGEVDWTNLTLLSAKSAMLLRGEDEIRFLPNSGFTGTASFKFKAWDQSSGTAGVLANTVLTTAYSTVIQTALVSVTATPPPPNGAPTLDASMTPKSTPIVEDTMPLGDPVAVLIRRATTDPNTADPAVNGLAVIGLTGTANGKWQYSTTGGKTWITLVDASPTHALLLRNIDWIRFVPNKNFVGQATFTFRAWDTTQGSFGQRADLTLPGATGGTSAFSVETDVAAFNVVPVNDAPVLDAVGLSYFLPQETNVDDPPGNVVNSLIAGLISDPDTLDPRGIAIVGLVVGEGAWQYQVAGAGTWNNMPLDLSAKNSLLLGSTDLVRFLALPSFAGVRSLKFKAWDQSTGTIGSQATTLVGTAFSKSIRTAVQYINSVNDKPILNPKLVQSLAPVLTDSTNPNGNTVASLLGNAIFDPDGSGPQGIAISSALSTATTGTWQFSTDGGANWFDVGTVSANSVLLLRSQDLIRFVPKTGFRGTARITYQAWDQTSFAAGEKKNPLAAGVTAFSVAKATSIVTVNTAPTITIS